MTSTVWSHFISSFPWYMVRACGWVAAVMLVFMIISGIGLITGFTFRFWPPIKAWAIHKAVGITMVFALLGHILFLLVDQYQKYSLKMILVPAWSSPWLAIGILATYFLIIIVISSMTIINTKKNAWKIIHYLSYVTIIFVFFHALNMGTDLAAGFLRWIWILVGLIILVAMLVRLYRARMIRD